MKPKTKPPSAPAGTGFKMYLFLLLLFTLCAVGTFILVNRDNMQEYMESQKKRDTAEREIARMQEKISLLRRKQQSIELNGVERTKHYRERADMHAIGEQVMFFEDETAETTPSAKAKPTSRTITTIQNQ